MNSCILMAEIINEPQIRYTSDNQAIAEMLVQFPALPPDQRLSTLKVVGWGNMAEQIQQRYHQGDRVVVEGRLRMSTLDRPEGFREKRAELTAQRIHTLTEEFSGVAAPSAAGTEVMPNESAGTYDSTPSAAPAPAAPVPAAPAVEEPNYDDIPF